MTEIEYLEGIFTCSLIISIVICCSIISLLFLFLHYVDESNKKDYEDKLIDRIIKKINNDK